MRTLVPVLVIFVAGCTSQPEPLLDLHLLRYASPPEIAGSWSLSRASIIAAEVLGYKHPDSRQHQLILRADGTYELHSITEVDHTGIADYIESKGRWRLEHDTSTSVVKKQRNEVVLQLKDRTLSLFVAEQNGVLILWQPWGARDEQLPIRYVRQQG
jgi:hypothetical protein